MTEIIDQAKIKFLTGEQGIFSRIQEFKKNNPTWDSNEQTKEFLEKLTALGSALEHLLNAADKRVVVCQQYPVNTDNWLNNKLNLGLRIKRLITGETLAEIMAILESLKQLKICMSEFKNVFRHNDDLSSKAKEVSDGFIKNLLEGDELSNLVAALELDSALAAAGQVPQQLVDTLMNEAAAAGLPNLDKSSRITSLFKVLLPELMTEDGKNTVAIQAIAIPPEHEQYREDIKKNAFGNITKNNSDTLTHTNISSEASNVIPSENKNQSLSDNHVLQQKIVFWQYLQYFKQYHFIDMPKLDDSEPQDNVGLQQEQEQEQEQEQQQQELNTTPKSLQDVLDALNSSLAKKTQRNKEDFDEKLHDHLHWMSQELKWSVTDQVAAGQIENELIVYVEACQKADTKETVIELTNEFKHNVADYLMIINPGKRTAIFTVCCAVLGAIIGFFAGAGVGAVIGLVVGAYFGAYGGYKSSPDTILLEHVEEIRNEKIKALTSP